MFLKIKNSFLFLVLVFLFSVVIFLFKNFIFTESENEEEFISYVSFEAPKIEEEDIFFEENDIDFSEILEKLKDIENEKNREKIIYNFFPENFRDASKTKVYKKFFDVFFFSKPINSKIKNLEINIYKDSFEVRWRLKNQKIFLYWLYDMWFKEALSVSIHEFWHFLDLYILKKWVFKDLSYDFYEISWDERNILKINSKKEDFVSGYAMTNMYEDFAESFNFYILHNYEFQKRAKESEKLQKKYDFFKKYVFIKQEFITDEYSFPITEKFIWDTTKQDFNFDKFKKYLEKIDNL